MTLRLKKEGAPKFYSTTTAAREIGIHPMTLRWLEDRGVVTPLRVRNTVREMRVFTEADVQTVIEHYRRAGGVQSGHGKVR